MAKNQIILWFLILFLPLNFIYPIETIQLFGSGRYVRFTDLQKKIPFLEFHLDSATFKGRITYQNKKEIKFRIDSRFYYHNKSVENLSNPIKFENNELYLPHEIIETMFTQMLPDEVEYKFTKNTLEFDIHKKKVESPEQINLQNIVIDAGHGGKDPGAKAINGMFEKQINLNVAQILSGHIKKKFPNTNVIMTRDVDEYIALKTRSKQANKILSKQKGTIFISIHCNAAIEQSANGYEVYYLAQTPFIEESRNLSILEQNHIIDKKRNLKIRYIQSQMMSSLVQRRSILLANSIHSKMGSKISPKILSRGVKKGNFSVLRESYMPAVLIEIGFVTHPRDMRMLKDRIIQMKIAEGIAEGIKDYVKRKDGNG